MRLCCVRLLVPNSGYLMKNIQHGIASQPGVGSQSKKDQQMTIKLYKINPSPPSRAVMMTCDLLGIQFEPIDIKTSEKQQFAPEYLKINPLHTVPVINDDGLILQDSHAILMYLSDKYAKDDQLYPKDLTKRALVNQKLFFECGILFPRFLQIIKAGFYEGATEVTEKQRELIYEAYSFLEIFLSKTKYIAGDNLTIADMSAFATMSSVIYILPLQGKYPKIQAWLKDMENRSFSKKYNEEGALTLGERLKNCYKN